tara:strand:+ start:237 stop:437 length:201 start_codon:yes stop_codon:yes gene_type:complete
MTFETEQEKELYGELVDIQNAIVWKLNILIEADWDSKTVKEKLRQLLKDNDRITDEIESFEDDNGI